MKVNHSNTVYVEVEGTEADLDKFRNEVLRPDGIKIRLFHEVTLTKMSFSVLAHEWEMMQKRMK